jgi:hypothetical protein
MRRHRDSAAHKQTTIPKAQHRHANMNIRKTRGIARKQTQAPNTTTLILTLLKKTNAMLQPVLILSNKQTKLPPSLKSQSMYRISGAETEKTRTFPFSRQHCEQSHLFVWPSTHQSDIGLSGTSPTSCRKVDPRFVIRTSMMPNNLEQNRE